MDQQLGTELRYMVFRYNSETQHRIIEDLTAATGKEIRRITINAVKHECKSDVRRRSFNNKQLFNQCDMSSQCFSYRTINNTEI